MVKHTLAGSASALLVAGFATLLVAGSAYFSPLAAQTTVVATPSVVKVLRKETALLVHAPNITSLLQKIEASPIYQLKNQPEFAKLFATFKDGIEAFRSEAKNEANVDPIEMLEAIKGEVVITFGDVGPLIAALSESILNMEEPDLKGDMIPFLVAVDTGSGRAEFKKNLYALLAFAVKEGVGVKTDKFHGGKNTTLSPPEGSSSGPEGLYLGELGTKYFFSVSKKFLEKTMVDLSKDAVEGTLAKTPEFRASHEFACKGSDFFVFVNLKPILKAVDQAMSANPFVFVWQTISEILFGKSLNNIAISYTLEKDAIRLRSFVHNGGADDGILGWFKSKPFSPVPPTIVPDDSLSYATTGLNGEAIGASVRKILELVQSFAALSGEVVDIEQMFEENVGVKFSTFLKSIGNRLHFFAGDMPSAANPVGDYSIILELKDDAVWKKLIDKGLEMTGGALQPKKYMGRDIFTAGAAADGLGGMDPALCVTDKMLLFSLSPKAIEKVIRRIGKDVPGIGDKPEFKKLASDLPSKVTSVTFTSKEYSESSMKVLEEMMSSGILPTDELPPGLIEFVLAISKTMGDAVGYSTWNDSGYFSESVAPYRK
jgi:hypothetical protein